MGRKTNIIKRGIKLLSIKNNKERKTLVENLFSLSLLKLASYIFPLITIPYLTKTIGILKYGEISFASAIMIYFQTVVDYGFIFSGVRDVARVKENIEKVSEIYSKIFFS